MITALQIASELGVHRLTISRIARVNDIGTQVGGMRIFSKQDAASIKKLCKISKGNPNFGKIEYLYPAPIALR